ncbi:MAG TPA: histidinol-phosphatase [Thermomicrobiaceae bacterium]|nr:histidinol-phosphatase [Thermomicrobiaceae bacterium]
MSQPSTTSYHTHSRYCDGHGEIAEVIEEAIAAGLDTVGISSHAPLPFSTEWNMPLERLAGYVAEVRRLQERYAGRIQVLLGSEIDYIPGDEVAEFQRRQVHPLGFDYYVGSVHFLGDGWPPRAFDGTEAEFRAILHADYGDDIGAMVTDYYRRLPGVLTISGVRVVGHLDVIKRWNAGQQYFRGDEPWYRDAVEGALRAIAASGHIVELNTAGWRKGLGEPYPSPTILARCQALGIPITVDSDSHTPQEVAAGFQQAAELLADLGIEPVRL